MKRALALSSVFIGIPTAVSGQPANNIYLDCNVIRTYSIPDEKRVDEKINFYLDSKNSIIYKFDPDAGVYKNTCVKRGAKPDFGLMIGSCFIMEEDISSIYSQNSIFFYTIESIRIFRGSGRLQGDFSMYSGPYRAGEFDPGKKSMVKYELNGFCVRGRDMSSIEKAF